MTFFNEVMIAENIRIHQLKKDNCDYCRKYEVEDIPEGEYEDHRKHADLARDEKHADKERRNDNTMVFTCDVEALFQAPMIDTDMF